MQHCNLQQDFISQYNGSVESILSFPKLAAILNPCFSFHYLIDHVKDNGEVVTTKNTTGEVSRWGNQTKEQEDNAYHLSQQLKKELLRSGAYVNSSGKYFIKIDGVEKRIPGMTTNNT